MHKMTYGNLLYDITLSLQFSAPLFDMDGSFLGTEEQLAEAIRTECSVFIPSNTSELLDVVASNPKVLSASTPYAGIPLLDNLTQLLIEQLEEDVSAYLDDIINGSSSGIDDSPWLSETKEAA